MFAGNGLIVNPNAPRPGQPVPDAPYGPLHIPAVRFGQLRERNRRNFNIGVLHGGTAMMTVNLACHHVVGWDIIWGFWNKLVTTEMYDEARDYLALFGAPKSATKNMAKMMEQGTWQDTWNCEVMMCWKPNNIVRGPEIRTDDPNINAELEDKIDFKRVGKMIYNGRLPALCETGRAMVSFINTGNPAKAREAITYFTQIRAAKIMEWDEDLWIVDEQYPGYSNTPMLGGGFAVVRPRWKMHVSGT